MNNLLTVAAPLFEIVSKKSLGSTAWFLHRAKTSHVIELIAPNIKLFNSFIVFPEPDGPTGIIFEANVSSSFLTDSTTSISPPIGRVQLPTAPGRPKIGQSK